MNSKPSVRLSFFGATNTVTGSKYLIEVDKYKILVDCGLFQGEKELRLRNWSEPEFNPSELSAVLLTHAHIDHTGYLPLIVKRGFKGPVYCTSATYDLLHLLLIDSAHLQEEQSLYCDTQGVSKHSPALPLYNEADARQALKQLVKIERDGNTQIAPKINLIARCAGHILGSVSLSVECYGRCICFSGDVGRYDMPILPDPSPIELGDVLLCESTYGNREHGASDIKEELAKVINCASDKNGAILIPSFAVGRTQTLLYYLSELEREGQIKTLPVYVDSPMAVSATEVYRKYRYDFDEDAKAHMAKGESTLTTEFTRFCRTIDESKYLNHLSGARIIISASGMMTGGRILHHLRNWLPRESTTIVFVGYQAQGTRGQIIQSGQDEVKIFGEQVSVRAHVETISGLSAHADKNELVRWLKSCGTSPHEVKVVHGEKDATAYFSDHIKTTLGWHSSVAEYGEVMEV